MFQLTFKFEHIEELLEVTRRLDYHNIRLGESYGSIIEKKESKKDGFTDNKMDIPKRLIYNYDDEIWTGERKKMARMAQENNYNLFMFNNVIYFMVNEHEYYRIGVKE
ncbi:TPA: hypothetical protein ACP6IR_000129 [Clostridioides difficile]|nr:hypothetical protein [Clostridioides difficile]